MPQTDYEQYLSSPHWASKRKEAFKYYGRKCTKCGSTRMLQVHHKDYARLGAELMTDLTVLCYDCHCVEHGRPISKKGPSKHKVYWARRKLGIYGELPWKTKH